MVTSCWAQLDQRFIVYNTSNKSGSSFPTHPVPVEAKSEAVQLFPHGLDVTEVTQSASVKGGPGWWGRKRLEFSRTSLSTPLDRGLSQWLRFLLEVQKRPNPLDSTPAGVEYRKWMPEWITAEWFIYEYLTWDGFSFSHFFSRLWKYNAIQNKFTTGNLLPASTAYKMYIQYP